MNTELFDTKIKNEIDSLANSPIIGWDSSAAWDKLEQKNKKIIIIPWTIIASAACILLMIGSSLWLGYNMGKSEVEMNNYSQTKFSQAKINTSSKNTNLKKYISTKKEIVIIKPALKAISIRKKTIDPIKTKAGIIVLNNDELTSNLRKSKIIKTKKKASIRNIEILTETKIKTKKRRVIQIKFGSSRQSEKLSDQSFSLFQLKRKFNK